MLIGVDAPAPVATTAPIQQHQARHIPGLAPTTIRPPSWWRGNRAAWSTSVQAARELGEPAAKKADAPARPRIGSGV